MSWLDRARAKVHTSLQHVPGKLGDVVRKANDALGRPLADEHELADRRQFAAGRGNVTVTAQPAPKPAVTQAPVIVYFIDRKEQSREVKKLTDILDSNGVVYTVTDITEDPAAQYAVKRDSNGLRLPVVFVAGECIGAREHLVNAASSGELKKKAFG
jgi:glutaredoxin-related protein